MNTDFQLTVVSREGVIFEGQVESITSYNEKGKFDVLGQHANFISLISKGLMIRTKDKRVNEIKFDNALLRVRKNVVEVYIGVEGMSPAEISISSMS